MTVTTLTYTVPYTFNPEEQHVQTVHAGGRGDISTRSQQLVDNIVHVASLAAEEVSSVANTFSAWADGTLIGKEFALDGIAWNIAEVVRQKIVRSVINWVNSGFQGQPMFVQDLGGFLLNVADEIAGSYLQGTGLGFLCDPFRIDIQIALNIRYRASKNIQENACQISEVFDNIRNAVGVFDNGWQSFFTLTMNPQATPHGALLTAEGGMYLGIMDAQGREILGYNAGDGFLNKLFCFDVGTPDGVDDECLVGNPGKVIQDKLTFSLNGNEMKLVTADEFNELLGAFVNQLVMQAFSGTHGLLGYGGSSNPAYTDAVYGSGGDQDIFTVIDDDLNQTNPDMLRVLQDGIRDARDQIRQYRDDIALINEREANFNGTGPDPDDFYNGGAISSCYTGPRPGHPNPAMRFPTELVQARIDARDGIATSTVLIADLQQLYDDYQDGNVSATTTLAVYTDIQRSIRPPSKSFTGSVTGMIADLDSRVQQGMRSCNGGGGSGSVDVTINGLPATINYNEDTTGGDGGI